MKIDLSPQIVEELRRGAREVAARAYAPYSKFPVGAAVLCDGAVYTGANVENASFGLSMCAERNAILNAVGHGARRVDAICVYAPSLPVTPCGACLQVIAEFGPDAAILCCTDNAAAEQRFTLTQLLPAAFRLKT